MLPEKPEPLQRASTAGGKLFASYLKDVTTRAYVYIYSCFFHHLGVTPKWQPVWSSITLSAIAGRGLKEQAF